MDLDPFAAPLSTAPTYHSGWQLGNTSPPTWRRGAGQLDAASVHELLRRADLPLSELRHMGWRDHLLSERVTVLLVSVVSPLLGRVVWDHVYGNEGQVWVNLQRQQAVARRLGRAVITEHFRAR